ncbi:MAG TPA: type II and III secretion system protein [Phycisphaerales bacterium]|nr:type II and III secretion system protein [Phycisphaerales bacterium]
MTVMLCVGGCGDFFAQKPTELQTRAILSELEQVKESPHIKNPLPEMYRGPAKRIKVKNGVKLFYFTKQHPVANLAKLINKQFATMTTDNKGKTSYAPDYAVSENPATNQLIVDCPNDQEADKVLEFLKEVDVPPIQVNIDCLILERFADVTMDWETSIMVENLLGEKITLGGKKDSSGKLLPAFPGASLRESKRSTFGLDFGYWKNKGVTGHELRTVVDLLISRGYLKILMNPTVETINGQKATIKARDFAPIERIVTEKTGVTPYSLTDFKWVEDILEVTPHVFADGSIGLTTKVQLGSRSKPEGVVQTSIITERTIEIAENRIKPGNSLIIGGIRKSEKRSVIRGVPFFKDIPIIGILFSSKDFEEKATEIIFILTPSISSGGVEHAIMMEEIRQKYAAPKYERGLGEVLTDPFGTEVYREQVEQKAAQAEFERFKAEIEKVQAMEEVGQIKEQLLKTAEDVLAEKARAERICAIARTAKQEAREAKQEAEKAKAEAKRARAEAEKAKADAQKREQEAETAETEAK